jgi:dTDP-glucose 4,6-dehydratase
VKVLVTGSEGTLGRPLVSQLVENGHDVHGVDLDHSGTITTTRADVREHRQLRRVFDSEQPELVFHLAAEFGRINGNEWFEQNWTTNMVGTRNVIDLCMERGAKLVFASSSEVYGELEEDPLVEDHDQLPLRPANDYAISKWANELQILNSEKDGLECVRCRFFNAYGPGETYHPYRSVVALFCAHALLGRPWTVYEGYSRVFMYVDDFIPTLARTADRFKAGEVYNIGGRDFRSVRELSDLVLEHTGADHDLVTYMPEDLHNVKSKRPDISKAGSELGHDPTITLEEGVPRYLEWLRGTIAGD